MSEPAHVGPDWFRAALDRAGLTDVQVGLWEGGVRLSWTLACGPVALDVHRVRPGDAYLNTPSFTLYVHHEGTLGQDEASVLHVVQAVRAADPGGLVPHKGAALPEEDVPEALRTPSGPKVVGGPDPRMRWRQLASGLGARLKAAARLAEAVGDEPYPFEASLGPAQGEALRAWVIGYFPSPLPRPEFGERFGEAAVPELMGILGPIFDLGLASLEDERVVFHAGPWAPAWRVFLWSEAVRSRAEARWTLGPVGADGEALG